jgi:multiple sugar transport system substrate-binding protein
VLIAMAYASIASACVARREPEAHELHVVTWKPAQPAVWDEAVHRFELAHPGITVKREIAPQSSSSFHDLLTQKLKNRDPTVDVYLMDVTWTAEFAAAGWALELDRYLAPAERAGFLPAALGAASAGEKIYAVPIFVDFGLLYFRKDLLEKYSLPVPSTWPELEREAARIVEAEGEAGLVGYSAQLKQYEGLVCNMLELVAGGGGRLVDEAGRRATLEDTKTLDAVRWVRDHLIGAVAPRGVLTYEEPESLALFVQGKAVFHRNWPYAWEVSNNEAESRIVGKVGVAPLPRFPGGRSTSALGGWMYGINAYSRRPDDAWSFVRFMTSEETATLLAREAGLAPARTAPYGDAEVRRRRPVLAAAGAALEGIALRPRTPLYPAVSDALQRFFSAAIVTRTSDVEGLAAEADREIERYLEVGS